MAKTTHGLPETKGFFRLRGITTGLNKEDALKTQTFDSGSVKNTAKIGIKTDKDSTVYVNIEGFKSKDATLFKYSDKKGEKPVQKKVSWDERYKYVEQGYSVIGVRLGLAKDNDGKNITNTYAQFDAAQEVKSKLSDNTSVYLQGQIDYSSFKNRDGDSIRSKKLLADALFLNSKEIDFDSDEFEALSDFKQRLIYIGIDKHEDGAKFVLEAKIVTRNSIENAEFIIYDKSLATTIRKNLKPYQAIDVTGRILSILDTEEVEETGIWGKQSSFDKVNKSFIREYVIEGANPNTIDTETYSEEIIDEAIQKLNSEGQQKSTTSDNWGNDKKVEVDEDDLPW